VSRPATDRSLFLYRVISPVLFHGGPPGREARRLIATRFGELNATNVTAAMWAAASQHCCVSVFEGKTGHSRPRSRPEPTWDTISPLARQRDDIYILDVRDSSELWARFRPADGTGTLSSHIESPAAPLRRAQGSGR